ncbi:hypothetical protein [Stackebrandtia soli]|uniref:hypothetical protein n=1 Tax=Stackebrandtia soli TaxID=1892856 RepID=UPI0039ED15FA
MYINIPQVRTTGQRIGRVGADAESYVKSVDGSMRQVLGSNEGFGTIQQLRHVLDELARRRDSVIAATTETARDIDAAVQRHVDTEERTRTTMENLRRQLSGQTPGESLSTQVCTPNNPMGEALGANNPATPPAVSLAGAESVLHTLGMPKNSPLGSLGTASWATGEVIGRGGDVASWMADAKHGRFAPRGANGQFISPQNMSAWDRAVSGANGEFRATPGASETRAAWSTAGKWAGRAGNGLSTVTSTAEQAVKDSKDPELTGDQKVGRAVWRGAMEGGGTAAGGLAGAKIGAGIGTLITPGVGTVIGGALGGLVGGIAGSQVGGWIADHSVEAAGNALEWITPW